MTCSISRKENFKAPADTTPKTMYSPGVFLKNKDIVSRAKSKDLIMCEIEILYKEGCEFLIE